ncbi:MAG: magnesium transporter [Symbiobacteriaceae bacterium]|nr:magnesium transporter [Symbiobacteriaceae bacterium]
MSDLNDRATTLPNLEEEYQRLYRNQLHMVQTLLPARSWDALRRIISVTHAADLAKIMGELEPAMAYQLFRMLPTETAAQVLEAIDDADLAGALLDSVNQQTVRDLLDNMSDDDLNRLLRDLDESKTERFLAALLAEDAREIREMLKQGSGTSGAIMTAAYMALQEGLTVSEALQRIRERAEEVETINYLYIVGDDGVLNGVVTLPGLLVAPRAQLLGELMTEQPVTVKLDTTQELAAQILRRYDFQALPVVDDHNVMQGIITFDDAMDVLEEQGGAEIYQLAGLTTAPSDKEDVLLRLPPIPAAIKRLPWVVICLFGDMITGGVIKGFEDALTQVIILAFFIPVLMNIAGTVGTQSLAIAVRAIAIGDLTVVEFFNQVKKEVLGGVMLGFICGCFLGGYAFLAYGEIKLSLAVSAAMWVGITFSSMMGMVIPSIMHRFRMDPALASGPLITTIADMFTIYIFFRLSSSLLGLIV